MFFNAQRYFAIADSVQSQIQQLFSTIMFPEWVEKEVLLKIKKRKAEPDSEKSNGQE